MKNQTLQYYMHDGPTAFRFELAGELDREGARRLEQDWRTASSVIGDRRLNVDITFVTSVDEEGSALLARWHREGAKIIAHSNASCALAESIVGKSNPECLANVDRTTTRDRTWRPFRTSSLAAAVNVLLALAALLFPTNASAATLKPETAAAWEDYLRSATEQIQDRVRPGGTFLWTFEDADRAARVRGGEIIVSSATGPNPTKIPGGLIHHWVGAVFLPALSLDETIEVTRDYDRYKEFYRPSVVDSKTIACQGAHDKFSMLLMNKVFLSKTALDAEYQATNVRVDDRRFYRVSRTTRVQEIEEYGQSSEHRIHEGEGHGYIWKLYGITRFEERDGGVYVEIEAMALSRDIPAALKVVADPIVRRISRNSLFTSLQQTEEALQSVAVAKSTGVSTIDGHMRDLPASLLNKGSAFAGSH